MSEWGGAHVPLDITGTVVVRRGDGSSYTLPTVGGETVQPIGHARREYAEGCIDAEEFELRVAEALYNESGARGEGLKFLDVFPEYGGRFADEHGLDPARAARHAAVA